MSRFNKISMLGTASALAAAAIAMPASASDCTINGTADALASPGLVTSGSGDTEVVCGIVTTTDASSTGIMVSNTSGITAVTGDETSVSGTGSLGIDVATTGTGAVTITTGAVSQTGADNDPAAPNFAAVRVVAAGAAPVLVIASGDVSSTSGAGIWAQSADTATVTISSGATVQGGTTGVALAGAAGNTLNLNGTLLSTAVDGLPYTVAGGPLTLNIGSTGQLIGVATFTPGDDTLNNAGTFSAAGITDFLGGTDVFTNTGVVIAIDGAATFANLETFSNSGGLLDMRDGAAGDTLTISGDYAANGNARLGVDVSGGSGSLVADRLVIGGTSATGTTTVLANVTTPVVDPTGALVVETGLGTLPAGSFILGGDASFGMIDYAVDQRGGDAYVVARPNAAVADTLFIGRMAQEFWHQSADQYWSYAAARRVDFGSPRSAPVGLWGNMYFSDDKYGDENRAVTLFDTSLSTNNRFKTIRRGVQGGIDFGVGNLVIGATGGYEHARGWSAASSRLHAEGYNYGAYAQFGMATGLYAGALVKRDNYRLSIGNQGRSSAVNDVRGHSTGVEGEVGFRVGGFENVNVDLNAGLAHVWTRIADYSYGFLDFGDQRFESTRGRLGARATLESGFAPFIEAKVFHEFDNGNSVRIASGVLEDELIDNKRGTWGRVEAGLGGGSRFGLLLSGWVEFGDSKGMGVRGGFRF